MADVDIETRKLILRGSIKSLDHRKSNLSCRIAIDLGITGSFFSDDLDLDDPRVDPHDRETYLELDKEIYVKTMELEKLEYPDTYQARWDVWDFLSLLTLEESIKFLRSHDCLTSHDLIEKVASGEVVL